MITLRWTEPSTALGDPDHISVLSPAERTRMERFVNASDAARFAAAWSLARRTLGELIGTAPADLRIERTCALCGHPTHGKPRLRGGGLDFSLSYATDRAVLAVTDAGRIGVDAERADRRLDDLVVLVLHPDEPRVVGLDLLDVWVRKEAVIKATGHGLARAMTSFRLADPPEDAELRDISVPGYRAAIALIDPIHASGRPRRS